MLDPVEIMLIGICVQICGFIGYGLTCLHWSKIKNQIDIPIIVACIALSLFGTMLTSTRYCGMKMEQTKNV